MRIVPNPAQPMSWFDYLLAVVIVLVLLFLAVNQPGAWVFVVLMLGPLIIFGVFWWLAFSIVKRTGK